MSGNVPESALDSIALATRTQAIDPDASEADFPFGASVYVGTGGDVVVQARRDKAGTKTVFKNCPDGFMLPVAVLKVWPSADGTTATDLVATWRP